MLNVLWQHLRTSALFEALIVCVWALGSLPVFRHGDAFFWWTVAFAVAVVQMPYAVEWRAGTERLIHSLPVSRAQVAYGHVLAAAGAVAVALGLAAAIAAGLASLVWGIRGTWPAWVAPEAALVYVAVATPLVGLQVIANHRWSMAVAGVVTSLAFLLAFVAVALLTLGPGGPLSGPRGLFELTRQTIESTGWPLAGAAVVAGAGTVFWLAARACRTACERREF